MSDDLLHQISMVRHQFSTASIEGRVLDAAAARIRELEAEREWRPIDDDAKSGRGVLMFGEPNEVPGLPPLIASGYWQPTNGLLKPGFWRGHHASGPSFKITHYMPLSAPPKEGK